MLGKPSQSKVQMAQLSFQKPCKVLRFWFGPVLGTPKEPGILPRVLDATFYYIGGHQYEGMDLKPYLRDGAQLLDPDQVKLERSVKATVFASVKDVRSWNEKQQMQVHSAGGLIT